MDDPRQDTPEGPPDRSAPNPREQAFAILSGEHDRSTLREQLNAMREIELKQLLHDACVRDASAVWREISLRRFIRQRGVQSERGGADGRQDP